MAQMRGSLREFLRVKGKNPVTVLELGVCTGENAQVILNTLKVDRMFLLDLWHPNYHPDVYLWAIKAFTRFESNPNVFFMKGNAIYLHNFIHNRSIDYLYIDDNHSPEHVKRELEVYMTKVKSGGMMAGHDYDIKNPDRVKSAVDGHFENLPYTVHTDPASLDWWVWIK